MPIGDLWLRLLWYFLQIIVSTWYSIVLVVNLLESYFISLGVLEKYKFLNSEKVQYLAIVIESEEACQISELVKLLKWLDSIGVKNEVSQVVTPHAHDHMTLEFLSYVDGKEAVAKAANLVFVENLKQRSLGEELDAQISLEPHLNEALQIVAPHLRRQNPRLPSHHSTSPAQTAVNGVAGDFSGPFSISVRTPSPHPTSHRRLSEPSRRESQPKHHQHHGSRPRSPKQKALLCSRG
ncbi:hypothetical protein V8G54_006505 [Vigna mungo]|uniref:ditrans,polycis-polyprenyl diphosphate synthase [(2E,6E)-farnesyldiphosphate specific] n=1 Tax=Vigna mungo TaxID=3915 RepID=A0AAQ3P0L7_VIGMU